MLFRSNDGKLIEVKKHSFINDKLYYEKLLEIKKPLPKLEKTFQNKYYNHIHHQQQHHHLPHHHHQHHLIHQQEHHHHLH